MPAGGVACRVTGVPPPWLNRVIGLGEASADAVPGLVAWFAEAGIAGRFDVTPDGGGPAIAGALSDADMLPRGGDALVWGPVRHVDRPEAVKAVRDHAALEVFLDTHLAGLDLPAAVREGAKGNMRGWLGQLGYHLLLARRDGAVPASCVLFQADGIAYVADMATTGEHRATACRPRCWRPVMHVRPVPSWSVRVAGSCRRATATCNGRDCGRCARRASGAEPVGSRSYQRA